MYNTVCGCVRLCGVMNDDAQFDVAVSFICHHNDMYCVLILADIVKSSATSSINNSSLRNRFTNNITR